MAGCLQKVVGGACQPVALVKQVMFRLCVSDPKRAEIDGLFGGWVNGYWFRPFLWWVFVLCMGAGCTQTAVLPTPALVVQLPAPTTAPSATPPMPENPTPPPTTTATATATAVPSATPLPSATPCRSPGRVESGSLFTALTGTLNYRIYLPPCYGQNGRSYPTLYMLPGNVYNEAIWDHLGLDETAESLIQQQTIPPLLIVMVDGGWIANNTSGGPGSYETVIVTEVIPAIETNYCAWGEPAGRAIGGMSRGGYWALEIAFQHPALFAAVGGHSAALIDSYAGPDINPQYSGLNRDLGNLRIYLDIGRRDPYITQVRRLHEDMTAVSRPHTWVMNEGTHEETYWITHLTDYLLWYTDSWPTERDQYPVCGG